MGFFILETKTNKINFKHETTQGKKEEHTELFIKKRKKTKKQKKKKVGVLNYYDFAYAGRDTVNQAEKLALGVIKSSSNEINNVAQKKINQIIAQGGKDMERVLPKTLREGIEDVYQTPLRLLRNFGKQQLNKLKKKILYQILFVYLLQLCLQRSNNKSFFYTINRLFLKRP